MTECDAICAAVRDYVEALPTDGGRGHRDDWRDKLDRTLADIRVELSSINDDGEAA